MPCIASSFSTRYILLRDHLFDYVSLSFSSTNTKLQKFKELQTGGSPTGFITRRVTQITISVAVNARAVSAMFAIMSPQSYEAIFIEMLQPKGRHRRESKNKKQETKRFSTFAVYRLRHSETKKNIA